MKHSLIALPGLALLAGIANAALVVTADYDFADNTVPAAFGTTPYGTGPATGGGVLTFDGTTAIQASTAAVFGSPPPDNFGYEMIATPSALNAFDIAVAVVDGGGTNSGSFLFQQSSRYRLIECGEAAVAGTTAPVIGTTVALAFVMDGGTARLYVNGALEASRVFTAGGPTPIDTATLEAVVLGGNLFDGAAGAFNGTIDRARFFTFTAGTFDSAELLGPADGTIPEPGSLALLGLAILPALRRRRV